MKELECIKKEFAEGDDDYGYIIVKNIVKSAAVLFSYRKRKNDFEFVFLASPFNLGATSLEGFKRIDSDSHGILFYIDIVDTIKKWVQNDVESDGMVDEEYRSALLKMASDIKGIADSLPVRVQAEQV